MYCSVGSQDAYSGLKCSKLLIHKSKLTFFAAICILVLNFAIGFRMKALQTVYLFQADKIIRGEGRQLFITGRHRLHVYCLSSHEKKPHTNSNGRGQCAKGIYILRAFHVRQVSFNVFA